MYVYAEVNVSHDANPLKVSHDATAQDIKVEMSLDVEAQMSQED